MAAQRYPRDEPYPAPFFPGKGHMDVQEIDQAPVVEVAMEFALRLATF